MLDIIFMVLGIVTVVFIWLALYDGSRFVVTKYKIEDERFAGPCRGVVLADLHNKCFGKDNCRLIDAIREQKPDFIIVAGDIPTAKPGKTLKVALDLMDRLAVCYPVYYANGNHEHRLKLYPEIYGGMADEYEKGLNSIGIKRLVNEKVYLPQKKIVIYGSEIDKFFYKRFRTQRMDDAYLEELLGKPDKSFYNILIAHNPDYFPNYSKWGADLVLSGHIHGGMVRIPFIDKGAVSPNVTFFPKYDGGMYKENGSTMILSRGLGMHTIPLRLFNPGEIVVIDFLEKNKK